MNKHNEWNEQDEPQPSSIAAAPGPESRYSRQIRFRPIGMEGQAALSAGRAAVVGMGALGCIIAQHLVRAGIGYIRIIDRDIVERSNLQRQLLYKEQDADNGLPKAEAAASRLRAMNSSVAIEPVIADVSPYNTERWLSSVDVVLDGTDNFSTRYLLNDYCVKHAIPWIYGGAVGASGMTMSIIPSTTPCYRCLFRDPPLTGTSDSCETAGVISPVVDVIGSIQAAEAIKLLSGRASAISRSLMQVDLWHNVWMPLTIPEAPVPDCPCCVKRSFTFLNGDTAGQPSTVLCGRNAIQVAPPMPLELNLDGIAAKLAPTHTLRQNAYVLKVQLEQGITFVLFHDGRAIVQGTDCSTKARSIYSELLGI
ncbi:ThiF family adenylyltransferase [Paenibacillus sp. J5C_2022]|uniref:ThiF family adenylyltransferase n=1 Tax=Paenibacillus sp. J5C2022 TaxID=2977129 RepID=UPI0021D329B9|nr:ThiF family adenylyltransferase [Paenibacillus sp. J5C2022]MCU6710405.1 ThiF family adenylyltransferase [Paenibacillus sp. J5C2022]